MLSGIVEFFLPSQKFSKDKLSAIPGFTVLIVLAQVNSEILFTERQILLLLVAFFLPRRL